MDIQAGLSADPFVILGPRIEQRIMARLAERVARPLGHVELFLTDDCMHRCDYSFAKGKNDLRSMPPEGKKTHLSRC
jgi:hypothetical protein